MQFLYSRREKENFQAAGEDVNIYTTFLEDERAIFLQLYEAKRDVKLSTDRREIL